MNIHDLWAGAIISIESPGGWGGRKRVWIHINNQRFPLTNWADHGEGMAMAVLNLDRFPSFRAEESQSSRNN